MLEILNATAARGANPKAYCVPVALIVILVVAKKPAVFTAENDTVIVALLVMY